MRIVEPQKSSEPQTNDTVKSRKKRYILIIVVAMLIGAVSISILNPETDDKQIVEPVNSGVNGDKTSQPVSDVTNDVTGNQLRIFYNQIRQANTASIPLPPPITQNVIADTRIRQLAETRGYKLRTEAESGMTFYNGVQLQQEAISDWVALKQAASSDGIIMNVTSGFRSVDVQRELFLSRLRAQGASVQNIIDGVADDEIVEVLKTTALPGYSKHHSGYTVDLLCAGTAFENFKSSPCFTWLSENNYERAFDYGFIPSYPEDADLQGPDPEAWEYVWVGPEQIYFQ